MPLGVCSAVIIKYAAVEGSGAVEYIELSLICVCTNRKNKSQSCPCAESIIWEHTGARGFGQKRGNATCSLGMGWGG